jgi:outer membrane protein
MTKNRFRIWLPACWLLSLSTSPAWAVDPALTLEDCFRAAQKQSEILAGQTEQINQAEARYWQTLAGVLPAITLQGTRSAEQTRSGPLYSQTIAKLSAVQPLFRGFREFAALRQSQHLIIAEREAWQWAGLQLYSDVSDAMYTLLSLETERIHIQFQLGLYDQRIKDLNDRVRIGRSRDSEVLNVQAARAALEAQDQEYQGLISVARDVMAFLTGLPRDSHYENPPSFAPALDLLDTFLKEAETRPDITAASAQVEAAREAVGVASGGHWPELDARGNYYIYESGVSLEDTWDAELALTLPLFLGGAVVAQTDEARAKLHESEWTLQRLKRLAEQEIRSRYAVLQVEVAQQAAWEKASKLAHQNYLSLQRDYNLGLATNLEVLQALADDQETLRRFDRSRFATWITFHRLQATAAMVPVQELTGAPQP